MKKQTNIFSIFGQIEGVIADALVAEHKAHKIEFEMIPPSARFNDRDQPAHCALVMSREVEAEFNRRVAALYA